MKDKVSCVKINVKERDKRIFIHVESMDNVKYNMTHMLDVSETNESDEVSTKRIEWIIAGYIDSPVLGIELIIKIKEFLVIYLLFKNKRNLLRTLPEGVTWIIGGKLEHNDLHNLSIKIDIDLLLTTRVFKFVHKIMKDPTSVFPDFFPIEIGEFRQRIREDLMTSVGSLIEHELIDAKIEDILSKIEWRKK